MSNLTYSDYWAEINSIAGDLVSESMADHDNDRDEATDDIFDSRLHETIDGHQWVIYYSYNLDVLEHSENGEAYQDVYCAEDIGNLVTERGVDDLHMTMAFFAMYQDVADLISDKMDEFEEELGE